MNRFRAMLLSVGVLLAGNAGAAPIYYDELVHGELGSNTQDTELGPVDIGVNIIRGAVSWPDQNGFRDFDGFQLNPVYGLTVTSIELEVTNYTGSGANYSAFGFVGSNPPEPTGGTAEFVTGNAVIQYIGLNPFLTPFSGPENINLQTAAPNPSDAYGGFDYEWRITVVSAPEPATTALLGIGLAGLILRRRRQS